MRKYILLLGLCCFTLSQLGATEMMIIDTPQDSIRIYKGKKKIDIPNVYVMPNFTIPDVDIPDFGTLNIDPEDFNFSFNIDSAQIMAWRENMKNLKSMDLGKLKENMKENQKNIQEFRKNIPYSFSYNYDMGALDKFSMDQKDQTPKKVENKTFSNISEVSFIHKYGNILVRESKSRNVELEIQYFGNLKQENPVSISSNNGLLSIHSKSSIVNRVNFIISVPRNTKMNIDLKYGHLKMGEFGAPFSADLSYSSFNADGFSGATPVIKDKHGKISIGTVQDVNLSTFYSDVNIDRAGKVTLSGVYSDYRFNNVKTIMVQNSATSGGFNIGSLGSMDGKFNYTNISIDELQSGITATCNYSDIKIKSVSQNANINVKGNYSDVELSTPNNIGVSFNVMLKHGDFDVAKKYAVKYTEQTENSSQIVKKGRIGSQKPTATVVVLSNYSDVTIK